LFGIAVATPAAAAQAQPAAQAKAPVAAH